MIKKMLSLFKQWHAFLEFEKEELTLRALQEGSTGEARSTVRKLYRCTGNCTIVKVEVRGIPAGANVCESGTETGR